MLKVIDVDYIEDYKLRLTFNDGVVKDMDLKPHLVGPVFGRLLQHNEFVQYAIVRADGKTLTTRMALDTISKHFSLPHIEMVQPLLGLTPMLVRQAALEKSYNPLLNTATLKSAPPQFEIRRNTYSLRPKLH